MAIAGRWLTERDNRDAMALFYFDVYALAGDGCMIAGRLR
jgi:transketolase